MMVVISAALKGIAGFWFASSSLHSRFRASHPVTSSETFTRVTTTGSTHGLDALHPEQQHPEQQHPEHPELPQPQPQLSGFHDVDQPSSYMEEHENDDDDWKRIMDAVLKLESLNFLPGSDLHRWPRRYVEFRTVLDELWMNLDDHSAARLRAFRVFVAQLDPQKRQIVMEGKAFATFVIVWKRGDVSDRTELQSLVHKYIRPTSPDDDDDDDDDVKSRSEPKQPTMLFKSSPRARIDVILQNYRRHEQRRILDHYYARLRFFHQFYDVKDRSAWSHEYPHDYTLIRQNE